MKQFEVLERESHALPQRLAAMAAKQIGYFVFGFMLSGARLFSLIAPLGVSAIASVPSGGLVAVSAGSMLGYLAMGVTAENLRYIAACIIAASVTWLSLFSRSGRYYPYIASLIGALSLAGTSILVGLIWDYTPYLALMTISETMLAAGAGFFLYTSLSAVMGGKSLSSMKTIEVASTVMLCLMLIVSLQRFSPASIPMSGVLAAMLCLLSGWLFKEGGGALMGTAVGLAFLLMPMGGMNYFAMFAVAGLVGGLFSALSRPAMCGVFFATGAGLAGALFREACVPIIVSLLIGSVLFLLVPDGILATFKKNSMMIRADDDRREEVSKRLLSAAEGLENVGSLVTKVSERLTDTAVRSPEELFENAVDSVCKHCDRKLLCHDKLYDETLTAFGQMKKTLARGETLTKRNIPLFLLQRCKNPEELLGEINGGYRMYAAKQSMGRSVGDLRQTVIEQFSSLSGFLEELSDRIEEVRETDRHLTQRTREFLKNEDVRLREVECTCDAYGRMTLQFTAENFDQAKAAYFAGALGELCGRKFLAPEIKKRDRVTTVRLLEEAVFSIRYDMKQQTAEGEKYCGDGFDSFLLENGFSVTLLCDGMGRGGMAAVDGKMAVGLMGDLVKAGFSPKSAVSLVNAALFLKSEEESTSTVDMLIVDLYTGKATLYKSGAAPTYIKRGDRVIRIDTEALPIGILTPAPFGKTGVQLKDGDVVVMTSDGAMPEEDVIAEALRAGVEKEPATLTARLMNAVKELPDSSRDDITIAVFYLNTEQ